MLLELIKKVDMPDKLVSFFENYIIAFTVLLAIAGIVIALWGYKFAKVFVVIAAAAAAALVTNSYLVPLFADKIPEIPVLSINGAAATVVAIIAGLVSIKWPRLVVFFGLLAAGYFVGGPLATKYLAIYIPGMKTFLESKAGSIIVAAVVALVLAILVAIFFKLFSVLITSAAGALITTVSLFSLVLTNSFSELKIPVIAVAAVLTVAAFVFQYVRGRKHRPLYY